mgnify:CR=1 FL=1
MSWPAFHIVGGEISRYVTTPNVLVAALSVSIFAGSAAAILAWREGNKPGARPLAFLLIGQVWWSISSFFRIQAATVETKLIWLMVLWVGVVAIPLGWFLFALEYTGRDRYIQPMYVGILAVIPFATLILVATGGFHNLFSVSAVGFTDAGILRFEYQGLWYWVVAAYTYILGAGGVLLLLELIVSQAYTFRKQALALLIGLIVPWSTNLLYLLGVLDLGIDPTPIAFSTTGVLYLVALKRFHLIKASPAPNKRARRLVFDGVQEGTIVLDIEDHIVDINEPALETFELDRRETLGTPIAETIPEYEDFPEEGKLNNYLTVENETGERDFELTVKKIESISGKDMGKLITLSEVTDFIRQQQRLEVLNRVFRHNMRTETNLILGHAEELDREEADIIKERALRIEDFGEKGKDAIELFSQAREESDPRSLDRMLRGCISDVSERFQEANIEYQNQGLDVSVEGLLVAVFENAIENAIEHNEADNPLVTVKSQVSEDSATIDIVDNGPGISEYELSVLSEGVESPLKHTSGLGLWIITWGVDLVEGTVSFVENDFGGTTVRIEVPVVGTLEN